MMGLIISIVYSCCRGLNSLTSFIPLQRPMSAMPWSLANATSYLERALNAPWSSPSAAAANPAVIQLELVLQIYSIDSFHLDMLSKSSFGACTESKTTIKSNRKSYYARSCSIRINKNSRLYSTA